MSWSKIISTTVVIMFVIGIAMINGAAAAEKMNYYGTVVTTKWQQMEIGDKDGHVIALQESKQVYFNEKTGEKATSISKSTIDLNIKTGQGSLKGYGVTNYPNGDKIFRAHEGEPVAKGHWKGTYTYTKGTGKYDGVKGKGTWNTYSLAPQISYIKIEGEVDIPKSK